ncbi:MAG: hypothetical protein Q7U07_02355 [Gammaproteobacteria bacterium]|nr:hypothetical protein [Gammaproteobacteria bacterium]
MSIIQNLFQQAQLAEAAYENFFDNSGNLIRKKVDATLFYPGHRHDRDELWDAA